MNDVREEVATLLEERPEYEDVLLTLLELDTKHETWAFEDTDVDSGMFGELVSRGIVEKANDEYRISDREAVRAAIENEEVVESTRTTRVEIPVTIPPRRVSLALVSVLALIGVFRLFAFQSVFRAEHVVLLGNDPYYYRYWLFRFIEQGTGVFSLPEGANVGEPLLLATLLAATKLLGGTTSVANLILAWYPVVSALLTALLIYILAVTLTKDRRVGLSSVAILAMTPVHAYRTAIGFADHHAFDFFWLALTVVAAISLLHHSTRESQPWLSVLHEPITMAWVTMLGISIAAQVLAWNAGPILLFPLAVYGVVRTAAAVKAEHSPFADLPLIAGVVLGGVLALAAHVVLQWQYLYIVVTPLLLGAGLGTVVAVGELARRYGLSGRVTLGALIAAGSIVFAIAYVSLPEFAAQFTQEVVRLFAGGASENIAETASLFSPRYGTIVGPFFFFGLSLFFALPYLAWGLFVGWSEHRPAWLLVGSYGGLLFVLALLQVRFAGHLALFVAVFAGLAIVHLLAITDATERPAVLSENEDIHPWRTTEREAPAFSLPDQQTVIAISLVFLLVGGLGAVMTPLRTNLLTVSDESYNAATFMEDYSERQGWEYPQNYVFSEWGDNRMYNAFVNGESHSYAYAQQNYEDFLTSKNELKWYHNLQDRAGFIVVDAYSELEDTSKGSLYNRLQNQWGSKTSHYRVIWASDDGSKKVYTVVPGAIVVGQAEPGQNISVSSEIQLRDNTVTYEQTTIATKNGWYSVRVSQPGIYKSVNVTSQDIRRGGFLPPKTGPAQWPLEAGRGETAFDIKNGHHGHIRGGEWVQTQKGRALSFAGNGSVVIEKPPKVEHGFSLTVRFHTDKDVNYRDNAKFPRIAGTAPSSTFENTSGIQLALSRGRVVGFVGNGSSSTGVYGPTVTDGDWHTATLYWTQSTVVLLLDGERVDQEAYTGTIPKSERFVIGASADTRANFHGTIDTVTLRRSNPNSSAKR